MADPMVKRTPPSLARTRREGAKWLSTNLITLGSAINYRGKVMASKPKLSDLHRAKRGVAALVACLVQTVNETDSSFEGRFLERLSRYGEFKDNTDGDVRQEMELLSWTREYLTGWNTITGQGKRFLED